MLEKHQDGAKQDTFVVNSRQVDSEALQLT